MFNNRAARWGAGKGERRSNTRWFSSPNRPGGITAIAVLQFVGAAVAGLMLLQAVTSPPQPSITEEVRATMSGMSGSELSQFIDEFVMKPLEEEERRRSQYIGFLSMIAPIAICLNLAVGVGLLMQREWARRLAMWLYAFSLVGLILANLSTPLTGSALMGIAIAGVIFFYLAQPSVRQAFR